MVVARVHKLLELYLVEKTEINVPPTNERGGALPVLGVSAIALSHAIVEERKQDDNDWVCATLSRYTKAVGFNSGPMVETVNRVPSNCGRVAHESAYRCNSFKSA